VTTARETALQGDLVRLRPRTRDDIPHFVRWYSDPDVRHWLHMSEVTDNGIQAESTRYELTENDPTRLNLVIETLEGRPIGNIALIGINDLHGRAELGIGIGEKDCWSRGYGTDSLRVLLRHAFTELGLRRITLITDIDNERGIRSYEKAGFRKEGVLRAHRLRYGQPIDMLTMAVLRDEWETQ
jgi:RimJ/RimL family protein N-acetyltransferase